MLTLVHCLQCYYVSVVCNVQEGKMNVRGAVFNIVIATIMVSTGTINTLAAK